jgi:putative holliday junction resolvase
MGKMIILAVDYGERRTGLAVSDALGITAQGLDTITVKDERKLPSLVAEVALSRKAERIVIGLPLNMNGSESEKSVKVRTFGEELGELTGLKVFFMDERMTSQQAHKVLQELEKKTRGNKELIDKISATLILQDYLKGI